jgi:hypothetical protein
LLETNKDNTDKQDSEQAVTDLLGGKRNTLSKVKLQGTSRDLFRGFSLNGICSNKTLLFSHMVYEKS